MAKGVATQTIVGLVIGLIVIVGLGYLVWTWIGRGGGASTEKFCQTKAFTFCADWSRKGYSTLAATETFVAKNPDCSSYSWAILTRAYCEGVLG
ncbi:MAG: hypothetical protein COY38_03185 [Candidatus Aenigmarchaeota archaeon CG_4_10_14_0_8_um_filter_37_24]|nr:hypothetical protein [Candidatus Aenigmarchaeota archaeon]OIN87129.1 MAG: hypothetical protein AUJ50_03075 [Candidatus Aenigmarchaeota archaeon CG1_02_38_14]PIV69081.1 MAG: hypothetical protein COS07_01945 [Candidatus Aenigmarchaeota archaeon CG01_land_8_20_14_3_00_37_9]PIW41533.1 MAG: hypothetical protein COW21_01405 [Candidatus Aenigmarchaeota archaeon CG15_BIG_FIL_POST_REV_8_21_14_020_37_27]PIX51078.1 MAG: hypothetical protein COZ52_00755 [Candidatus Aenigmarchaeota archaeon CG_4_8_14_3_u